jgi:hypothetical protein
MRADTGRSFPAAFLSRRSRACAGRRSCRAARLAQGRRGLPARDRGLLPTRSPSCAARSPSTRQPAHDGPGPGRHRRSPRDPGPIAGKRFGLITNPSGVTSEGVPTWKALFEMADAKLVRLFGPEHGVDGGAIYMEAVGNASIRRRTSRPSRSTGRRGNP